MRRSFLISAFLLFALLALMSPALAQDNVADWTYMQYFLMDNNLESALYGDLQEMQAVGSTDRVNMVAQVDRIPEFENGFGDWTDTRRFLLKHEEQPVLTPEQKVEEVLMLIYMQPGEDPDVLRGQLRALHDSDLASYNKLLTDAGVALDDTALIDKIVTNRGLGRVFSTEPLADLGEVDMGDPAALVDFVTWAMTTYPAHHYALTLSTHGSGWLGNGPDETDNKDMLQLSELVQALGEIQQSTGIEKFDLIGFDACLMGQLEVYQALAPYTQYVLASEELIPGNGWEYTTPFTQLVNDPTMDAAELGTNIIDAYMAYYSGAGARTKVDLGLIDTSKIQPVIDALSDFMNAADTDMVDKLSSLGVARINAQFFDSSAGDSLSTITNADFLSSVDLISFMQLLTGQADIDPDLSAAAQGVIDAAQAAIVLSRADDYLPDAHGMSIYFPINTKIASLPALIYPDAVQYPATNPAMEPWLTFLGSLHATIDTELTPDKLKINVTDILPADASASIYDPPVILFDINGQGISNLTFTATLTTEDGTRIMVDNSPIVFETELPDGRTIDTFPSGESIGNNFAWDVETLLVGDGATEIPSLLFMNNAALAEGVVSGTYHSQQSSQDAPASVLFSTDTSMALATYGTTEDNQPYEIQTQPGDKFTPNWYSVTSDGLTSSPADNSLVYGVQPFIYRYVPAASGNYTLTMILQDLAGNYSVSSKEVKIDNTGLDPAWRGMKDIVRGLNFLIPWEWSDPFQLADESGQIDQLELDSPDGSMQIFVAMRDADIDSVAQDMYDLEASLTDAVVDEPSALGDDASVSQIIGYTYTGDDGTPRSGAVIIVRVEGNNATYTFDIDAPKDKEDEAVALIEKMADSITFFAPQE